jgi:LysM repeat protein
MTSSQRIITAALSLALMVMLIAVALTSRASNGTVGERLVNGGFEQGFTAIAGCGAVGNGWGCFTSGGAAFYGFYDEGWPPVVASGRHAQLIEINTRKDATGPNSTAGIYQTVAVVPGQSYELSFQALMRADDLDRGGDPWRYVMLVGFDPTGGRDWTRAQWQEVDVGPIQDRANPGGYSTVRLTVRPQGPWLTVFIAGRMKWGDWNREVDFDVDNVSLRGPVPPQPLPTPTPPPVVMPPAPPVPTPTPSPPPPALVCDGPNLVRNGNFEAGFDPTGVARFWGPFNNGGAATYGYYDDTWPPVVAEGRHAQLLEINTSGRTATHPNRFIGIYQRITGLRPGAVYEIRLQAMIREEADHSDEDPYRYEVYWGYRAGATPITDVAQLTVRRGVPVAGIGLRTAPGPYSAYSATFTAPASEIVLYLLGLKKWATLEREVDFDLDDVQVRPCRTVAGVVPPPPPPPPPTVCTYVVRRGDTLSAIARRFRTTVADLARANGITNPNRIFRGQVLIVPCDPSAMRATVTTQADPSRHRIHTVRRGENLGQIARRYDTTVSVLRRLNRLGPGSRIRAGQQLLVPVRS